MLSALQHWSYCPRQCALIHLEQAFDENVHTMRGNAAHARVDEPGFESFEGVRSERALPVWSDRLGLVGKCDVVEFHPDGKPILNGAIYHHPSRRRREVAISPELRQQVEDTVAAIRAMLVSGKLPPPANDVRCKECSLIDICQPQAMMLCSTHTDLEQTLYDPED